MGKASGGTKGRDKTHSSYSRLTNKDVSVFNPNDSLQHTNETKELLKKLGHSDADIDEAFGLIRYHVTHNTKDNEDEIMLHLNDNDGVGKVFVDLDAINRKVISYNGMNESLIYRGGGNRNIESWTTNSRGVQFPVGPNEYTRLYSDRSISVKGATKDYLIVSGYANKIGQYGESEVTLLRKKGKASTEYRTRRNEKIERERLLKKDSAIFRGQRITRSEAVGQLTNLRKTRDRMSRNNMEHTDVYKSIRQQIRELSSLFGGI